MNISLNIKCKLQVNMNTWCIGGSSGQLGDDWKLDKWCFIRLSLCVSALFESGA